jgi:nitroreductase
MEVQSEGTPRQTAPPPEFTTVTLGRRRFLVLLGGAAAYATLAPRLGWAGKKPRAAVESVWTLPETLPANGLDAARALIGASILAPSYWNAQPWRFEVDPAELRLTLDPARTLPACDPDQRFALLSLGAALENLLVAARAWGLQPTVQYLPHGTNVRPGVPLLAARITWTLGDQPRDRVLFSALAERRSNPGHYGGRTITMQARAQLLSLVPEDMRLHWIDDRGEIRKVARLVREATESMAGDERAQAERAGWLRLSDGAARRRGDGVTPERIGLGGPLGWLAARAMHPRSRFHGWGTGSWAHEAEDTVRSSGALALLTTPKRTEATTIAAGQAYERFALQVAAFGLAQQPLSAPIESAKHRTALAARFAASGEEPLLLVRLGHAKPPDPAPRRAVALVSTWRNS